MDSRLSFKKWFDDAIIEAALSFGAHRDKDIADPKIPTGYLSWVLDTVNNPRLVSPEMRSEIQAEIQKRRSNRTKPVTAPVVANIPQEKPRTWVAAKVIGNHAGLTIGQPVALSKNVDGNWDVADLSGDGTKTTVNNLQVSQIVQSVRDHNNQPITGANPMEVGRKLNVSKPVETQNDASKHILSSDKLSQEQADIDKKFEKIMNEPNQSHIMISALAGTGKTSILKHLAWKYGKPGQKWLYLVFNTKNKVEGKQKFPAWVEVKTTNGFLGEILRSPKNANKIPQTDRMAEISKEKSDKIPEKARILIDGPKFAEMMLDYKLTPPEAVGSAFGDMMKTTKSLLTSIRYNFKEVVLQLAGLAKAFSIDPRKPDMREKLDDVTKKYDIDFGLDDIKERINKYRGSYGYKAKEALQEALGFDFMSKNFKDEIINSTEWLLKESMPGASEHIHNHKGQNLALGEFRDFNDDLWFAATHADQITWPHYDFVLADEVQDFNDNQKVMLRKLHDAGAKIVAVGDENQCVIEGTLISTKNGNMPVELVKIGQKIKTAKGRGNIEISNITNKFCRFVENLAIIRIVTKTGKTICTTPEHTHFAGYIRNKDIKYFTYLMFKEKFGFRVGVTTSNRALCIGSAKMGYAGRLNQERADKIWLIDAFLNKHDAQYHEQLYSIKYGIPTWTFKENGISIYQQEDINKLFNEFDSTIGAKNLLKSKKMFIEYPHHIPKCTNGRRYRNFNIVLCGDGRLTGLHRYSISGSDESDSLKIKNKHIKIRKAKRGWRCESSNTDLSKIYKMAEFINKQIGVTIIEKAAFAVETLPFTPASHVLPGMTMFVQNNENIIEDIVESVDRINYTGNVYDLNIERYHNFIGNGIVTHNSIYRFRGADSDAFNNLSNQMKSLSADKDVMHTLSGNFRSKPAIIDFSNKSTHVKNLEKGKKWAEGDNGIVTNGDAKYNDIFENLSKEKAEGKLQQTAFLARTNEPLVHSALNLLSRGIPFVIIGKDIAGDLRKHIDKVARMSGLRDNDPIQSLAEKLQEHLDKETEHHGGKSAKKAHLQELTEVTNALLSAMSQFLGGSEHEGSPRHESVQYDKNMKFASFSQFMETRPAPWLRSGREDYDPSDRNSKYNSKTIADFKQWLNEKLGGLNVDESEKDLAAYNEKLKKENPVVLTTAHKSKGLEFGRVYILRNDQFPHPKAKRPEDLKQEENGRYVAYTRAQNELHIVKLDGQPGYKKG